MTLPATLRALRYRNFQLFFGGQLISLIGTWMQNVAQAWLVYRLTGSSVLLGLVSFSSQIPVFLMSPVGGIVADRFRRRRVVIGTQTASMLLALVLAALTLTGAVQIWHIFVLSALLGVVNAFDIPARQAFFVEMVGREDLINAIALNSSMFNASRIIGPAVAGILVAGIGEGWCFFANGVSYIAVIAGLLLMTVAERTSPSSHRRSPLADVIEGFRFVIGSPPIHHLLILLGILSVTGMPFAVLMPIFADQILHGGAKGLGILMGASGVGALAGALLLAVARKRSKGLGRWVAISAGAFGAVAHRVRRFALVLGLLRAAAAGGLRHDGGDGIVEHADPNHVAGPPARTRDVGLFDDVHGYGAAGRGIERRDGRALGRARDSGRRRRRSAWRRLPSSAGACRGLRTEARRLIAAAQMAGGVPPQSGTGGSLAVK